MWGRQFCLQPPFLAASSDNKRDLDITKYGYARVSTDDQNPALQLAALKKAGCQTVFNDEGISGTTTKRPALLRCLKKLEHGDTLIVWKLDRLGRSLRDLI